MSTTINILEVGRHLNAVSIEWCRLGHAQSEMRRESKEYDAADTRLDQLLDETILLQNLALAMSPRSVDEAAVQVALLFYSIEFERSTDDATELQAALRKIERGLVGITRQVAIAARVDLSQFGNTDLLRMMDLKCPEMVEGEDAPDADAELIAACTEAARCEKWRCELNALPADTDDEPVIIGMNRAWRSAFERVAKLPASTPAGIRAKAATLRLATVEFVTQSGPHFTLKDGNLHERLAVSLCDNIERAPA